MQNANFVGSICLSHLVGFFSLQSLGRKQSRIRTGQGPKPGSSPTRSDSSKKNELPISGRKRWLWRTALLLLVPLLLFGTVELALRIAGYGFPTGYFKRLTIQGRDSLVDNDRFGFRFFPPTLARIPAPVVMQARKPPGTIRIFVFGESAAEGDPRPQFAASRYLEMLLRERFPNAHFEFVNTAITAINSHVILPIARDCAPHEGDFWIVYIGNNEMIGPFGAATAFGRKAPPLPLVRLGLLLQTSRTGQLLLNLARTIGPKSPAPSSWRGMEMFLQNSIPPDDPRKAVVYDHFERNLYDILNAGSRSGAKVLLSTVVANLKDCPPFGSVSNTTLSAEAEFHQAQALLARTNNVAAREHFQNALDRDTLIFRADSTVNGIVRRLGQAFADRGVFLCEADAALAKDSPGQIPGQDLLYEHVHLNSDGNYRLALSWAEALFPRLPSQVQADAHTNWASQAVCEHDLALTDWNRVSAIEEMIRRLKTPPFNTQENNETRIAGLKAQADAARQRMAATSIGGAREVYLTALRKAPDDFRLHENFAEFLEVNGDLKAAVAERKLVCDLIPHYYFPYYQVGSLLRSRGQLEEAIRFLQKAAALNPYQGKIRMELGIVLARQNNWKAALSELEKARELSGSDPQILLYYAEVQGKLGRPAEAMDALRAALAADPDFWEAHYRLGENLATSGRIAEAAAEFRTTVRLNPNYTRAHVNLGVALLNLGRADEAAQQFDQTLKLDPQNPQALDFLTRYRAGQLKQR
jgi:tetratricopeptide (TPR) repeat protein